jgi:hypothetical protein
LKRLSLSIALALLATLLCGLPAMAYTHQEKGWDNLSYVDHEGLPVVTTLPATNVARDLATLNATAQMPIPVKSNDGGSLVYVQYTPYARGYFQYGTASGVYTSITPNITMNYQDFVAFTANVTGLRPCTKYYARFVLVSVTMPSNHQKAYSDYLISFLSPGTGDARMCGLGVGLGFTPSSSQLNNLFQAVYGNEITFTTTGCQVSTGPLGQGGSVGSGAPSVTTTGPIQMSNIVVQNAALAATTAAPGQKVDVTASISNKGSASGDTKVTLYVNGQEMDSQGVTVASGQTSPVHFSLSMNEPGTYTVTVGNVPAGSLTVDAFANNDFLIYGLIALFTIGIAVVIYMVTRKRTA